MAVAPACRDTPQQCGCVREEPDRSAQENDSKKRESAVGTPPREGFAEEPAHGGILRKAREKTDSPGVRLFCYQGPGTNGRSAPENDGARPFPIQTGGSSELR